MKPNSIAMAGQALRYRFICTYTQWPVASPARNGSYPHFPAPNTVPVGDDTLRTVSCLLGTGLQTPYLLQNSNGLSKNSEWCRTFLISESTRACATSTSCVTGIGNTENMIYISCSMLYLMHRQSPRQSAWLFREKH